MEKTKRIIKKYYFVVIVILAITVKTLITVNLPINARDYGGADEYLMMEQAESLVNGNYLGEYNEKTLVKGIGFPLFLAFSYQTGISLFMLYSIFYAGVCLVALVPIRHLIKKRPLRLLVFLILLFCPATMDGNVQLIYRNMLIIPQSLLLVSALMMMYYHVNDESKKKLVWWTLVASFAWIFMWHTREDTIWTLPLLVVTWMVLYVFIIKGKNKKDKVVSKAVLGRIGLISLPFVLLFVSCHVISFINYQHYGIYTNNQLNNSNYTKAIMTMLKVKPVQEIERVEITRDTLKRLYEVSPSLKTLEEVIEYDYEHKQGLVIAAEDNGEINEDLITWELIGAAKAVGHYDTAMKAEEFWEKVYEEVNQAIQDGKLETRATLPSRSLIPYPNQPDSFGKLVGSIASLYARAAKYDNSVANVDIATIPEVAVSRYEAISGGYAVREEADVAALRNKAERWTNYANKIKKIYSLVGWPLLAISLLYYVGLTIFMIVRAVKKQECYFDRWLFLSAALGSVTVMLVGLGYVNAFMVDVGGYLSSCNGLLNLFFALSFGLIIQDIICGFLRWRKRRS